MRKASIVLAFLSLIIGIIFAILPMGTLGILPTGLAILFSGIAFIKSDKNQRNIPKWLLIIAGIILVATLIRSMIPDEVQEDAQFEQKKIESKQEDLKDLEELE
jgi:uncharacterized membrane protein HdeD (DUF308 family)